MYIIIIKVIMEESLAIIFGSHFSLEGNYKLNKPVLYYSNCNACHVEVNV